MKKIFDIRHIVIALLLILVVVEFINPKGIMPNRTFIVHDTIGVPLEYQNLSKEKFLVELKHHLINQM